MSVLQAAMATWKHMVAHASKASTTESPASGAARSSLLASLLGPVLQVLIKKPPETARVPPARPEPAQFLWSEVTDQHGVLTCAWHTSQIWYIQCLVYCVPSHCLQTPLVSPKDRNVY